MSSESPGEGGVAGGGGWAPAWTPTRPVPPALARAGVFPEAPGHGPAEDGWAQGRWGIHRVQGPRRGPRVAGVDVRMRDIPGQGTALESPEAAGCVCPQIYTTQRDGAEGTGDHGTWLWPGPDGGRTPRAPEGARGARSQLGLLSFGLVRLPVAWAAVFALAGAGSGGPSPPSCSLGVPAGTLGPRQVRGSRQRP